MADSLARDLVSVVRSSLPGFTVEPDYVFARDFGTGLVHLVQVRFLPERTPRLVGIEAGVWDADIACRIWAFPTVCPEMAVVRVRAGRLGQYPDHWHSTALPFDDLADQLVIDVTRVCGWLQQLPTREAVADLDRTEWESDELAMLLLLQRLGRSAQAESHVADNVRRYGANDPYAQLLRRAMDEPDSRPLRGD